jgi:hypothetical protein
MTVELTAPVVAKNDEKRIAFGPVLIPDEPDTDGDVVSAEKIEEVAHKFAEQYGNIDVMHTLNNVGKMVETYLSPVEMTYKQQDGSEVVVPKGSWMLGVRVTDDAAWKAVQKGELGGFSIMGIPQSAQKSAEKGQAAEKRTTLKDLGDNWIVNAVSLVDRPAVPKGKFVAIKAAVPEPNTQPTEEGIFKRLLNMMAGKSYDGYKEGSIMSQQQQQQQNQYNHEPSQKGTQAGNQLDEATVKSMIQQAVKEAQDEAKKQQQDNDTEQRLQEIEKSIKAMQDEQQKHTFTRPVAGLFKSVAGQDGEQVQDDDVYKSDRDPFGFKVEKGEDK